MQQAKAIVQAGRRLIAVKGSSFTTQELVREAGVALQTFYRYFGGKDQLLLAVIEDVMVEACTEYERQARRLRDPLARLRFYVTTVVSSVGRHDEDGGPRFITTEHWRLHRLYPDELAEAIGPFTDLLLQEIRACMDAGRLKPPNPDYDAWLITQLAMAVYHHYAFAATDMSAEEIGERVWSFCLAALGGQAQVPAAPRRGSGQRARQA
jgi:AcrR family transcriptional regulator